MIFRRLIKGYNWMEDHVLVYAFAIMVAITFTQVVFRYIFNNALSWSEEVARYIFVWISWLGVSTGVRDDEHIKVMLLPDFLKRRKLFRTEICLRILVLLLWIFTAVVVNYYGIIVIEKQLTLNAVTPAVRMPLWVVYVCIPFCGTIVGIRLLANLAAAVRQLLAGGRGGKPEDPSEVPPDSVVPPDAVEAEPQDAAADTVLRGNVCGTKPQKSAGEGALQWQREKEVPAE